MNNLYQKPLFIGVPKNHEKCPKKSATAEVTF